MLTTILHQSQATERLQKVLEGRITSPVLLAGPDGVGKRTAALATVRSFFCEESKTPNCECSSCYLLSNNLHDDLRVQLEDTGVDEVRDLIKWCRVGPTLAPKKFVVLAIDKATNAASNALLKILEEPSAHVQFMLLADDLNQVLFTIKSRCRLIAFKSLPESFILSRLSSKESDVVRALVYTRLGEGSVGRSLSLWAAGRVAFRDKALQLLQASLSLDIKNVFSLVDEMAPQLQELLRVMTMLLADLLVVPHAVTLLVNQDIVLALQELSAQRSADQWDKLLREFLTLRQAPSSLLLSFHVKALLLSK